MIDAKGVPLRIDPGNHLAKAKNATAPHRPPSYALYTYKTVHLQRRSKQRKTNINSCSQFSRTPGLDRSQARASYPSRPVLHPSPIGERRLTPTCMCVARRRSAN
eukprot:6214093-Pleurochrysis_carterae.AAC.4